MAYKVTEMERSLICKAEMTSEVLKMNEELMNIKEILEKEIRENVEFIE